MNRNPFEPPKDTQRRAGDGATPHLLGKNLPDIELPSTGGDTIRLATLRGIFVLYFYPMTGRPDLPPPEDWDLIPGARGCTPQSCAFRDHYAELQSLHAGVFGLSTQPTDYQTEARDRLHLPFELLSDRFAQLKQPLGLPTFIAGGQELYRRLTLIVQDAKVVKVFYPVPLPERNAAGVLAWLHGRSLLEGV